MLDSCFLEIFTQNVNVNYIKTREISLINSVNRENSLAIGKSKSNKSEIESELSNISNSL